MERTLRHDDASPSTRQAYEGTAVSIASNHWARWGKSGPRGRRLSWRQGSCAAYRSRKGAHATSAAETAAPQKKGPSACSARSSSVRERTVSKVSRGNASPSQLKRKAAREEGRADRGNVPLNALTMALTAPMSTPSGGHSGRLRVELVESLHKVEAFSLHPPISPSHLWSGTRKVGRPTATGVIDQHGVVLYPFGFQREPHTLRIRTPAMALTEQRWPLVAEYRRLLLAH